MFYSRVYLAKKGPLATVWIAAHLESRLRKSHLKKANIHSFIDTIMFPEVPIALRLSGHLLLGVVRIYSRKVDYLYHDCNEFASQIIRTSFAPAQIDLPEDKSAAFNSVTLPENFDLDAFPMDDAVDLSKSGDAHVKPLESITLQDQIPPEGVTTYIPLYLSEDSTDSSSFSDRSRLGAVPIREETLPFPADAATNPSPDLGMESSPDIPMETSPDFGVPLLHDGKLLQSPPPLGRKKLPCSASANVIPIGNLVDPSSFLGRPSLGAVPLREEAVPPLPDADATNLQGFAGTETSPDFELMPPRQEDVNDGDIRMEDAFHSSGRLPVSPESLPHIGRKKLPSSASANVIPIGNVVDSLGAPNPEVELQRSPPVRGHKARKRKRAILFEEKIVLTNAEIKKQLKDSKKLMCKRRRKLPCSTLNLWKFQGRVHLEKTFEVPSLSGLSYKLKQFFQNRYSAPVTKTPHTELCEDAGVISPVEHPMFDGSTNENLLETVRATAALSPVGQMQPFASCTSENPLETARINNPVSPPEQLQLDGFSEPDQSAGRMYLSELETTPFLTTDQVSFSQGGTTMESAVRRTANTDQIESGMPWSANTDHFESGISQFEIPQDSHIHQKEFGLNLAEIDSASRSPASDDMDFLDEECTTEGSEKTVRSASGSFSKKSGMSARTKAVAHYFKEHSPGDLVVDKLGALSLNKILEGKKRKHCARMFFETLVLKDSNYIGVHQKEAYGDVTVYLTPALSEILF